MKPVSVFYGHKGRTDLETIKVFCDVRAETIFTVVNSCWNNQAAINFVIYIKSHVYMHLCNRFIKTLILSK